MDNQSYCFCDLAPLYALGELSEAEQAWVEAQLQAEPDLTLELEEFQNAVTAFAYSSPPVPIAANLKDRLFDRIGVPLSEVEVPVVASPNPEEFFWTMQGNALEWQPHPAPGFQIAIFHIDPVSRMASGLLRAEPDACYPLHRHVGVEEIYMLEGDLRIGSTVYGPGDYIRSSPSSSHDPVSPSGCKFFFRACLDDEYLEAVSAATSGA
jgi:hypothetical protein